MPTGSFAIEYDQAGLEVFNTGFLRWNTSGQAALEAAADLLAANWAANIMPSLGNDISMVSTLVQDIDIPDQYLSLIGTGTTGGAANPSSPVNVAAVITRIDPTSRRKGRWFIPGVPEPQVDGGNSLAAPWYSNLRAQFDVTAANLAASDNTRFMNRHKTSGPGVVPIVYAYAEVTGYGTTAIVGSQSRRRG